VWYLYVVECGDGSLYCGIAKDVTDRVITHNRGKGAKYTRARRPVRLLQCTEVSENKGAALRAEYRFKKLRRKKKLEVLSSGLEVFTRQIASEYQ
jgi:putative endonuclease